MGSYLFHTVVKLPFVFGLQNSCSRRKFPASARVRMLEYGGDTVAAEFLQDIHLLSQTLTRFS